MKLKVEKVAVPEQALVIGTRAEIVRDDINGGVLVIQGGLEQFRIKLSDLVQFVYEQDRPETAAPETDDVNG